ncbi:MAG TPA: efflux RND transporter periplasmic adaptor subunit [Polyangia bacterium]|jgi:cobalt-zinc-cadmium efflux system membrane fusion protein
MELRLSRIGNGLLACASLLALAVGGCSRHAEAQPGDPGPAFQVSAAGLTVPEGSPLRQRLKVEAVAPRLVRHELNVPATAEADPAKMAKVSPPLPGRVVKLHVRLGDAVKQGAPLLALDSAELVSAQTDYLKARSGESQAARSLLRQKDLVAQGIGARKELEQAQTDLEVARSELGRATTRLRLLGMDPGEVGRPLVVRAPVSGRIIDLATAPGQYQNEPAAAMMTVADLSTIWVTASVPEKDIQRVVIGEEARIEFSAYPGQRLTGQVAFIGDVLVPETRSVKVRIQLDNPGGRLKPGMFARVVLRDRPAPELVVPPAALIVRGETSYVYVERAPWLFERRKVEVGEPLAEGVCITRGLTAGERIVTANAIVLP